ncbi:MAG: hypothetical protein KDD50_15715 [Bdellovibrionales bacterium]|nr:hypothetical protein [Bdellovibrionales bacterium]
MTKQEIQKKIEAKIESLDLDKCSECGYHAVSTLEEAVNFGISLMQDEVDRLKSEPPKFIKLDENTEEFSKQNAAIEVITMHKKDINLLIEQNQKLQAEIERWHNAYNTAHDQAMENGLLAHKLRSLITEMGKALELTQDHCLCNRNTYGFDYNETHRNLGKPEAGKRWLDPYDICANALELKEKVLKEIDTP